MACVEARFPGFAVSAMMRYDRRISLHLIVVSLTLTATVAASRVTAHRKTDSLTAPLNTIPETLAGFKGVERPPLNDNVERALNATSYLSRLYEGQGTHADLFIAYYAQQRAGESMHSPKHCLPGSGWEIWQYRTVEIPAGPSKVTINKYSISHTSERKVMLYWYQSKERVFASEFLGKLLLARDALLRNSTAAAIVRVIVPDNAEAVQKGEEIASEAVLQMRRCFGE